MQRYRNISKPRVPRIDAADKSVLRRACARLASSSGAWCLLRYLIMFAEKRHCRKYHTKPLMYRGDIMPLSPKASVCGLQYERGTTYPVHPELGHVSRHPRCACSALDPACIWALPPRCCFLLILLWSRASCLAAFTFPQVTIFFSHALVPSLDRFHIIIGSDPGSEGVCVVHRTSTYPRRTQKAPPLYPTRLAFQVRGVWSAVPCYPARRLPTHPPSREII